jgi:hypothetical protein
MFADFPIGIAIIIRVTLRTVCFPAFFIISIRNRITLIMGTSLCL